MKKFLSTILMLGMISFSFGQDLIITGVFDGPLPGGLPKVVELQAINNIADMSIYGLGSANNGGGTDGIEFTFPAISATAGECITIAGDSASFFTFFGFYPNHISGTATGINGDDAIELFENMTVIDIFGDINVDGTGQPWEYLDGWVYRINGTGPDGSVFNLNNWTYSGVDAMDGQSDNATATVPFPNCTYQAVVSTLPTLNFASSTYSFNEAAGVITIDVTLTNPDPVNAITVGLNIGAASTAMFATDYTTSTVSLTFPPGSTAPQQVTATIIDDTMIEPDETVIVELINPTNGAVIGNVGTTTVTIVDNDTPTIPVVEFIFSSTTAIEGGYIVTVDMSIVDPNSSPTSVDLSISPSSTASMADHTLIAQTITWPGNSNADQTVDFDIVDDALIEGSEYLILELSNPTNGAIIGMDTIHTVTINDNDFPVTPVNLLISGVFDGPLPGGTPKVIELHVLDDIPDLSIYGLGAANGGGGTDGVEFTFPAVPATAGSCLHVATDSTNFNAFFGPASYPEFVTGGGGATGFNGDDAIELFQYITVVDVFGDINTDGTGQPWEYLDGWAYRVDGTGPDGTVFDINNWTFSGINALDGEMLNDTAMVPFPICTYMPQVMATPSLSFSDFALSVGEGDGTFTLFVNITDPDPANPTTADITIGSASTASDPADYTLTTMQVTFPAGNPTTQQVTGTLVDDMLVEIGETIIVELSNLNNGVVGSIGSQTVTIVDNDSPQPDPEIFFTDSTYTFNEGDGTITIDVNIINPDPANATTVDLNLNAMSTATLGTDYSTSMAQVTFPAGSSTSQQISIMLTDDADIEGDETIVIDLTNPTNGATIASFGTTTVNIIDNDMPLLPEIFFADSTYTFNEADGTITVDVNIINPDPANATTVDLNLNAASTASFASDYTTSTASVTFPAGSSSPQQITAMLIDDADVEGDETIIVDLINPTNGAVIGSYGTTTVIIVDNDFPPAVEVQFTTTSTAVNEGDGTITVDLSIMNADVNPTSVDVAVATASTATAPDYVYSTTTVTFPGGSNMVQTVSLDIVDDSDVESAEDLILELFNPTNNAVVGTNAMHTITIMDNDTMPSSNFNIDLSKEIKIFPNPATDLLNITSTISIDQITITNVLGQEVFIKNDLPSNEQIDILFFAEGLYLISFKTEEGSWTKQLIKQ